MIDGRIERPLGAWSRAGSMSHDRSIVLSLLIFLTIILMMPGCSRTEELLDAAKRGDTAEVQSLIEDGVDVNSRSGRKGQEGRTALMVAASCGCLSTAQTLLAKGADVNARDDYQETPLMYAAEAAQRDIVQLLLAKGAEINAGDRHGYTALWRARTETYLGSNPAIEMNVRAKAKGYEDVRTLLLQAGATISGPIPKESLFVGITAVLPLLYLVVGIVCVVMITVAVTRGLDRSDFIWIPFGTVCVIAVVIFIWIVATDALLPRGTYIRHGGLFR